MKKNIRFLKKVKCRIEALPCSIWENKDTEDGSHYDKKRKRLKGEVMHIQNHIRGYILAKYGEGDLLHEFSEYSFFPIRIGILLKTCGSTFHFLIGMNRDKR